MGMSPEMRELAFAVSTGWGKTAAPGRSRHAGRAAGRRVAVACANCSRRKMLSALAGTCGCGALSHLQASAGDGEGRREFSNAGFAEAMEYGMESYEKEIEERKRDLFGRGISPGDTVLELGLGTGPNLRYYPEGVHVVGLEPNRAMHPYAAAKALPGMNLSISTAPAENSGFEDGKFDVVVCTLLLCSVQDPVRVLREAARNLRPGGKLLFCEHVAAPVPSPLWILQTVVNPLQILLADNCHLTRQTGRDICAEFPEVDMTNFRLQSPDGALIAPHIIGTAIRA